MKKTLDIYKKSFTLLAMNNLLERLRFNFYSMYYGMIKYRKEKTELVDELCDMGAAGKTSLAFHKDQNGEPVAVFGVNMDMNFEDARFMIVSIEPRNDFIDRFFNVASQNISLKTFRLKQ